MTYLEVLIILQIKYKIFPIFASTTAAVQCASPGGIALVIDALNPHYTTVHCNSMHMCTSAHCSGVQWYAMCIQYSMHCTLHSGIMVCIPARSDGNPVYTSAPIASDDQNDPGDEEEEVKIL